MAQKKKEKYIKIRCKDFQEIRYNKNTNWLALADRAFGVSNAVILTEAGRKRLIVALGGKL